MQNYLEKFEYLSRRQGGRCAIMPDDYFAAPEQLHHYAVHNTKNARAKFPLFIDSLMNLVAVSAFAHDKHRSWGIRSHEYGQRCELFLQRHPRIAAWVNNPDQKLYGDSQ